VCTAGAYRLQTSSSCGRYVRALLKLDRPSRLGRASLETLAIIAYRQPLTKSEIEDIRGVDVSANIKTLMDLQLIRLVGKSELPGHPFLYGTTPLFLDHFGLASLQQLNELDPTLQRSNPKKKAELYKKPEKLELEAAAKEKVEAEGEGKAEVEGEVEVESEDTAEDAVDSKEPNDSRSDDDDVFIDDTPDEFDDEDDEDEEDEDGEEGEDEEADGADGADDPDGV
jgi:segregation and condensation protein B